MTVRIVVDMNLSPGWVSLLAVPEIIVSANDWVHPKMGVRYTERKRG